MIKRLFSLAVLIAPLLVAVPASATTILASCSEDISCVFQGTVSVITTAGHFDSSYARFALTVASATTVPPTNRIETSAFSSASSNFWTSAKYYFNFGAATTANWQWMEFYDGSTVRLGLEGTGVSQQIRAFKRDGAGTKTTLATATGSLCAASTLCKVDVHIVYAVSGSVDVYSNGVNILTYSGDTTTNSATTLSKALFAHNDNSGATHWSEIIVSDSDTRSMRMVTCAPSAAGTTQNWTGSAANINANSYSDATFNYTTVNNDLSNWKSGCTIPTSGTSSVVDVRSFARLAIGSSGPQNARFSASISGTDYDNGADLLGLTTSFGNVSYDWGATNPAGGSWTPSGLNTIFGAGGFGVKSRP